jgi:transposase
MRAQMILMLAAGLGTAGTADRLGVTDRVVRKWRARWEQSPHLESLRERDRPGRARRISIATRCEVVKIACNRPQSTQRGRRVRPPVWTQHAIADELYRKHGERISRSSVQRILSASDLRPHRIKQWLHSPDPDFAAKVERICKLYLEPPPNAVVVSIDEKPMQALRRRHPTHLGADRILRREFEYTVTCIWSIVAVSSTMRMRLSPRSRAINAPVSKVRESTRQRFFRRLGARSCLGGVRHSSRT